MPCDYHTGNTGPVHRKLAAGSDTEMVKLNDVSEQLNRGRVIKVKVSLIQISGRKEQTQRRDGSGKFEGLMKDQNLPIWETLWNPGWREKADPHPGS